MLFPVRIGCLGGIQYHKIRFKILEFIFCGTDEHVLYKMRLPGHFHDEPDFHAGILVGSYKTILYIKLFPRKLFG